MIRPVSSPPASLDRQNIRRITSGGVAGWMFLNVLIGSSLWLPVSAQESGGESETGGETVETLVKRIRPSVVTVYNTKRNGDENGVGSGFFVGEGGLIVTNLHVIGEGRPIRVKLSDGSQPKVSAVHAWDRKLDLAVLRVDAAERPPLELAAIKDARQGTEAVAVGNPQGLEYSVTTGVVSAVREIEGVDMIQVAVPIERGNSGGPLLNRQGKVLGVLTLKSALTENLGFAMPAGAIESLLEKPNTVSIDNWLRFGALNPMLWEALPAHGGGDENSDAPGADWRQRTGTITVQGAGSGFGGRALCVSQLEVPDLPYEVSVEVKLDVESGAGGIAFGSDGGDRHYGFYPTNGQLRLTRFDGPTVYSWNILQQVVSPHYLPGAFNHLRVRVEKDRILCYLNGHLVIESNDMTWRTGRAGLCKFRETEPVFRRFAIGKDLAREHEIPGSVTKAIQTYVADPEGGIDGLAADLSESPDASQVALIVEAKALEKKARELRRAANRVHEIRVQRAMKEAFSDEEDKIDLLRAALLVSYLDNPDLVLDDYLAVLDRMAAELKARFETAAAGKGEGLSERQRLELLGAFLFEENGYHGSRADYYNPSNSFLNEVIDYREGIPITLSVVYMELARRAGLKVVGVPLPGHFVVRHEPAREGALPQLVDVFDGGDFISEAEAAAIVSGIAGAALRPEDLQAATKREIIVRMLRNLANSALGSVDPPSALPYLGLILALEPENPQDHLSRAILFYQSERLPEAREDIDWLIERRPPGMDIDRLIQWRTEMGG